MIYYLTALINGFFNSVNKMMNVKAGQCFGTAKGSLINYVEATLLSLALVCMTAAKPKTVARRCGTMPAAQPSAAKRLAFRPRMRPVETVNTTPVPGTSTTISEVMRNSRETI